jgi:hypothetical protein
VNHRSGWMPRRVWGPMDRKVTNVARRAHQNSCASLAIVTLLVGKETDLIFLVRGLDKRGNRTLTIWGGRIEETSSL